MLRLLIASLLMLLPAGLVEQNTNFAENNLILREKNIKRSEKSDEFVSYWMDDFRKDDEGEIIPICDITFNEYTVMIAKYIDLEKTDRLIVDATPDYEEGYTINDSITQLVNMYSSHEKTPSGNKQTLNQSSTIIIIVVIAVFGMSTICVFFVLKNNNLIN